MYKEACIGGGGGERGVYLAVLTFAKIIRGLIKKCPD